MFKSQVKLYFLRNYKNFYKRSNESITHNKNQEEKDGDINERRRCHTRQRNRSKDIIQDKEISSIEVSSLASF